MPDVARRLDEVRARIARAARACGRRPEEVTLLAVSKGQPPQALAEAHAAGQRRFGESYLQEARAKMEALAALEGLEWHFIGPIQSNKAKAIAARFDWVHSLDRADLAERLARHRPEALPPLEVCIQVNVSGEPTKRGVAPEEAAALAEVVTALPRLRLRGLMAIPAPERDPARQRAAFARLRGLLEALRARGHAGLDTLSMGMSADLEAAVAEGATIVRVGTALFGPRPPRRPAA